MTEPAQPDPFATVTEVQARIDWDLSSKEQTVATSTLADASDLARYYGNSNWTVDNAPRQVKVIVLRAVVRYMKNPEGYIQSRAGDESVYWADTHSKEAGSFDFSDDEQKILGNLAGSAVRSFGAAIITGHDTQLPCRRASYVPTTGTDAFPFFTSDTSPWDEDWRPHGDDYTQCYCGGCR